MNHNIDRLANILMHTSEDKLWNIVKQIKTQSSKHDKILDKVSAVKEKVKIETSESVIENMSREHLKAAFEMFLYLDVETTTSTETWLKFFGKLFETQSAAHIVLTLNRMMRKSENNSMFIVHEKLFRKATTLFKLKNQEIQSFMPGKSKNISSIDSKSSILRGMI